MVRLVIVATASICIILLVAFCATRILRSRRRGMSIRLQVFIALASVVGTFALGLGLMVLDRIEARAVRFANHLASDKGLVISAFIGGEVQRQGQTLAVVARQLPQRGRNRSLKGVEVYDAENVLLFRSSAFPSESQATVSQSVAILDGERVLGKVRVVKTAIEMERLIRDFAPTILVISLVLGLAAAVAALWIGRTIAGPIEALSIFAERVSAGAERALVPPPPFGREVTRLTYSVDSMRRQLEGRPFVETFAADLSHELKNPVAAIKASAEVLEDGALDEPAAAKRFVRRISEATERIERLLGELLGLARVEARGIADAEYVDLGALVRTVSASFHDERVLVVIDSDARVRGDRTWIGRALMNLIGNGLLHSESEVGVRLFERGNDVVVAVSNEGAIADVVRERLFNRFFTTRADKGGSGLGLAIVKAVAEAHRGQVELVRGGPPSVTFELTFPAR